MSERKKSLRYRLYHGETSFDFMGRKRLWFLMSGVVIALGLTSLVAQGLNLGIDFKGGVSWQLKAPHTSVSSVRGALQPLGLGEAKVQTAGSDIVRVQFKHVVQGFLRCQRILSVLEQHVAEKDSRRQRRRHTGNHVLKKPASRHKNK